ncbi:MAG: hypothetical protein IJN83_01975 [Clostridia bacterium]|nr:hypothetical protein [Clostridia bacterium]
MSCLQEMGSLSDLAYKYKGTGFSIIGLSADVPSGSSTIERAKEVFSDAGGKFTNLTYTDSVIATMLQGVNVVPTTKFYDSKGRLLTVIHGAKSEQGWINIIETVINEKA